MGNVRTSGPQVIHHQTGIAVGPHPWGVRELAQALLQAVAMGNPGWVLWCLLWSLPGTHTHTHTHKHTHTHTRTHTETSATCRPRSGRGSSPASAPVAPARLRTPNPVSDTDGQGTVPGPHSTERHHVSRALTPFKKTPE